MYPVPDLYPVDEQTPEQFRLMTYREYLIASIAAGALSAMYGNGAYVAPQIIKIPDEAYAELIAPQIIKIADEIIKSMEKSNAQPQK